VKRLGQITFPIIEELADDIVVVEDEETASTILMLLEREKMVVEGGPAQCPRGSSRRLRGRVRGRHRGACAVRR